MHNFMKKNRHISSVITKRCVSLMLEMWGRLSRDTRGVSLLIAIIFVAVFILMTASMAELQIRTLHMMNDNRAETSLRDLAKSASRAASWLSGLLKEGENFNLATDTTSPHYQGLVSLFDSLAQQLGVGPCFPPPGVSGAPCVDISVASRSTGQVQIGGSGASYYSVPAALSETRGTVPGVSGTGDAGKDCEKKFIPASTGLPDANEECYWNRLYFGESVEIPLYYVRPDGGIEKLRLTTSSTSDFRLRIRTPLCTADNTPGCAFASNRIELYPRVSNTPDPFRTIRDTDPNDGLIKKDPVLVQWLISDSAANETLVAMETDVSSNTERPNPINRSFVSQNNTEITAGRINDAESAVPPQYLGTPAAGEYVVLESDFQGLNINNKQHQEIYAFTNIPNLNQPILRLTLVERPKRDIDTTRTHMTSAEYNNKALDVPYLEYQLLTTAPVSDSKSVIKAVANIAGLSKEVRNIKKRPTTLSGFAFESF